MIKEFQFGKLMKIRVAQEKDIENIAQLFYETIITVNKKDYSEEQILAWSGNAKNVEMWSDLIEKQYFLIAEKDFIITGFASLDTNCCLDLMYVHKDFQGQGIATQLLLALENKAIEEGFTEIWTDSSLTAKPFFLSKGFVIKEIYTKKLRGIEFENTILTKEILHNTIY
jgi:putative acetyltransferase